MTSIRKTKKVMKKSSRFLTLKLRGMDFYAINEWDSLSCSKHGIIHNGINIPYTTIKRVIIEHA